MNNEKIILEMFSRLKDLEEKVENLESRLVSMEEEEVDNIGLQEEKSKVTRSISRDYVIGKLRENNTNILVEKGNRAMGSGIVITNKESGKVAKSKFYHSKSHDDEKPSGWHTVNDQELIDNNFEMFIFNLEYNGEFYTFIFTADELKEYVKQKEKDQNGNFYFYFNIKNDKVTDSRDGELDVSRYLNNWESVNKIV